MCNRKNGILTIFAGAIALAAPSVQASIVNDDLLAVGGSASGWQECGSGNAIVDVSTVGNGGCAYQEFTVNPNTDYRLTCGVTAAKYASITLAYSDANYNPLAEDIVEIFDDNTGSYSITLTSPANAVNGAIGIYGEHGTGVQDCVVIDANASPAPTDGSIAGTTWFDENSDGVLDSGESIIANTLVELLVNGAVVDQVNTDQDGTYYFGQLDFANTYSVRFTPIDSSLEITVPGTNSLADPVSSLVADIAISATVPNVTDVDAGFKAVPVTEPPSDYVVCGHAWNDESEDGQFNGGEIGLANVDVRLHNEDDGTSTLVSTGDDGSYVFTGLSGGNYSLEFIAPNGYLFAPSAGAAQLNASFPQTDTGLTSAFNLPGAANGETESTCTLSHANVGLIKEPTAIEPTVANDDSINALVGEQLDIDVTANDEACENTVVELDILGHNVPGNVDVISPGNTVLIAQTTEAGDYSIQYGVRGNCGSYDEATVFVSLTEPVLESTEMNYCRFRRFRQVVELWRVPPNTTQAVLNNFVPPASVVADGPLDLSGNMGWIFGSGRNNSANVSSIVQEPVMYGNHRNYYVFGAQWDLAAQTSYPALRVVGSTNEVTITNNDGTSYTRNCVTIGSPIALDLNQDGKLSRISGKFSFDLDGDGENELLTEWFSAEEGILYNASLAGEVSGEHLFGNVDGLFSNGYEKLATLDVNNNGEIDGKELKSLAIWVDANSNAQIDAGESRSLAQHKIISLSTEEVMYKSTATLSNGKTMLTEDMWFPHSGFDLAVNVSGPFVDGSEGEQ